MKHRTYSELSHLTTFDDRFEYLKLGGQVGHSTFGFDRHLNQKFYQSLEWKQVREYVILRDNGCDLGVEGYEIYADILIHHINVLAVDDLIHGEDWILDPEYLITTTKSTHNAIHYGDKSMLPQPILERKPDDTRLW